MILRSWKGATRAADANRYVEYLRVTGLAAFDATPGNRGHAILRRIDGDRAEFIVHSLWDSVEAVKAFAGDNPEVAVFYPEDEGFLVERDLTVDHYEVVELTVDGTDARSSVPTGAT